MTTWVDHILGSPLELYYRNHMAAWMDWREDPGNDLLYHIRSRAATEREWVGQGTYPGVAGDYASAANASIHGHFVQEFNPLGGPSVGALTIVAPQAH